MFPENSLPFGYRRAVFFTPLFASGPVPTEDVVVRTTGMVRGSGSAEAFFTSFDFSTDIALRLGLI